MLLHFTLLICRDFVYVDGRAQLVGMAPLHPPHRSKGMSSNCEAAWQVLFSLRHLMSPTLPL